jgi:hypothetical protein
MRKKNINAYETSSEWETDCMCLSAEFHGEGAHVLPPTVPASRALGWMDQECHTMTRVEHRTGYERSQHPNQDSSDS